VQQSSTEFFESLAGGRHTALLGSTSGTMRFDVVDGADQRHWYVTVRKGDIEVSQLEDSADVVVTADREVFDAVVSGEMNAMAAVLRGEVAVAGALGLVISFQRLFPGPPGSRTT
jgi:putative sterol carrier protein